MPIEGECFYEDYTGGAGIRYKIDKLIFSGKTEFQEVVIFSNEFAGKVLVLDGVVQATTADEFIYHEMLTHLPVFALGDVRKLLIVGGGDGGMLREALCHPRIEPTLIDIDGELVVLCKEHLPEIGQGAFDDPRANYFIGDGFAYVKGSLETFDLIIVDSTDPHGGPGDVLYSTAFFEACKNRLRPGGVVVIQSGVPFFEKKRVRDLRKTLGAVFADMRLYIAPVPTYFGGEMAFGWASDAIDLAAVELEPIRARYRDWGRQTLYYTPEIHQGSFAIPNYLGVDGPEAGARA